MSNFRKLKRLAEYGVGVGSTFAGLFFNFAVQIVLARLLGLHGFGQFALWRNNTQFAAQLSGLSLNTLALKRISELKQAGAWDEIQGLRRRSTVIVLCLSVVAGAAISPTVEVSPLLTIPTVLVMALLTLWSASNRALVGGTIALVTERALQPFLYLAVALAFLWAAGGPSVTTMGGVYFATFAVSLALVWLVAKGAPRGSAASGGYLALIRSALPFFAISVASFMSQRVPLLFSSFLFTDAEVGQLAFMLSLAGLIQVSLASVNLVAGPKIAAAHSRGDNAEVHREVRKVRIIAAAIGVPSALILALGAPVFEWLTATPNLIVEPAFLILLLSGLVTVFLSGPVIYLQMTDKQAVLAKAMNGAVLLKIALVVPLARALGLTGLAAAELVQAVLMGAATAYVYQSAYRLSKASNTSE